MPAIGTAIGLPFARSGGFVGALDAYASDLGEVMSFERRWLATYTGPLFRVKATSGGATTDIYPNAAGWLDEAALAALASSGNFYIDTLYGQKGLFNLTQSTFANMPRIVSAGVVDSGAYFVSNGNLNKTSLAIASFFGATAGQIVVDANLLPSGSNSALFNWGANVIYAWHYFSGAPAFNEAAGLQSAPSAFNGLTNVFRLLSYERNGSSKLIRADGRTLVSTSSATGTNSGTGTFSLGGLSAGSFPFQGYVKNIAFFTNATNAQARAAAMLRPNLLVCDGDSITQGTGTAAGLAFPQLLQTSLGRTWSVFNFGVSGQEMSTMTTNATSNVDPLAVSGRSRKICIGFGGTNDLYFGASAATVISRIKAYGAARKAAGYQFIMPTILPRTPGSSGGGAGTFETDRQTVNTEIRQAGNLGVYWDAVADVAADSRIGDSGDQNDLTYYQSDTTHPNAAGQQVIAEIMNTAISGLA